MRSLIASLRASIWPTPKAEPKPKRAPRERKPLPQWAYNYFGDQPLIVEAKDRSDARAMFKRLLGLKRLPAGCTPQRIG